MSEDTNNLGAASTPSILFVDDEPRVLKSLQRGLRRHRREWRMVFADSAEAALGVMRSNPPDLIISDITMPGTDGIDLLTQVRRDFPGTARILVSGTADASVTMRAVPVAHRFLSKPLDTGDLVRVIGDSLALRALVDDADLRQVFNGLGTIASVPQVYAELCAVLEDENKGLDAVVDVVQRDPAIVSRILHIVNSAFFRAPEPIGDIAAAVRYTGTRLLRDLALVSEVFATIDQSTLPAEYDMGGEQAHAIATAQLAALYAGPKRASEAYTADPNPVPPA